MSVALARKNLFHQKGKLILSVLSVGASLAMILLLLGFREGLYAALTAYVNNLGVDLIVAQSGGEGLVSSSSILPTDIHQELEDLVQAKEAGHVLVAGVIFTNAKKKSPVILVGYDPKTNFGGPWKLGSGAYLQGDDEIMLDLWLAKRSGIQVGDKVELLGREFTVIGLTRETSSWMSPYIFISLNAAQEATGLFGSVSYHLLRLPQGTDTDAAIQTIGTNLTNVEAIRPDQFSQTDRRAIAAIMDRPINVLLLVGIVIGIAIMGLASYTAITDRMREYSLLKAVGANSFQLNGSIIKETYYHAAIGLLAGIALAYLSAFLIMAEWPQFNILIQPRSVLLIVFLAILMSTVSVLLPMRRLAQIDPMEAFKA